MEPAPDYERVSRTDIGNEDETTELASDSALDSSRESTRERDPASDPAMIPEQASSSASTGEATSELVAERASDSAKISEQAPSSPLLFGESASEKTSELATEPASDPVTESARDPVTESASDPVTESASGPAKIPEEVPSTRWPPPGPSKKLVKPDWVIIIVSDGDLRLHVGDVMFIVCFKSLSRASKIFENKLLGAFDDHGPQDDDKPWVVSLPGEPIGAMSILLNIAHARFKNVDALLSLADLGMLAALSRKYGMTNMLRPWAKRWIQNDAVRKKCKGELRLLHIAWEFGDLNLYRETITMIISWCEVSAQGRLGYSDSRHNISADAAGGVLVAGGVWDYRHCELSYCGCISHLEHLRPADLRQRILKCRETLLQARFLPICKFAASLKDGICRARDHEERYRCKAMALGSLNVSCDELAKVGITIMPEPSLPSEWSIGAVNRSLNKSFNIRALCENCKAQIEDIMDMFQSDFEQEIKKLELYSAADMQQMAIQATKTGVSDPGQWSQR
ncbi:nuclear pore protein-like protein [Colletotrichum plurivorum]|uniref:Nuclear pore protein-like protein n=1 Tax=Colletotrichum plurivorum TaxID=2175906 RepID=A0A8H6N7E2_9PEZI|nr:nuclear pore protein-like protein [Colletotrichum plurivorum]